jgi:GxxExxY protein
VQRSKWELVEKGGNGEEGGYVNAKNPKKYLARRWTQIPADKKNIRGQSVRGQIKRGELSSQPRLVGVDVNSLTESVIGAAFEVSNTLGAGFLEKVYERALVSELTLRGIAATQATYPVAYKGHIIAEFQPDMVVENILIVELKCVDRFAPAHLAQCISYLQASGLTLALLLNFQHSKVQCRRVVREF